MTLEGLDDLDRAILGALQRDARHTSSGEIAERMDVSASTVRKRIQRLESEGIITGYHAAVDYERAGYPLYMHLICTAPIPERESLAAGALAVPGVVDVREIATGTENVVVTVVAADAEELTTAARRLVELGLTIGEEELIRGDSSTPFDGFASDDHESTRSAETSD
ncbi:Lrp/AsnC family transcriptional regulator [Salinigranum halophilum]|uniref:Lrp/AsnC family transcriptional regulator n=1 Tax=Salinigranum halophilum TaxID=2565931 RepID=UPI0010A91187|nr:winged helix-turn-helix transcriptional regulator [Salinigranum halophilum]